MSGKTSAEWWSEVKADPVRFNEWLVKQYRGEVTAAVRIRKLADRTDSHTNKAVLNMIASQENTHASWVLDLLNARGIVPTMEDVGNAENRYWKAVAPAAAFSFNRACAIASHAEGMRLERIRVISEDYEAPEDVRVVFKKILKEEIFHEKAFASMAGADAMSKTQPDHEAGRQLLGLVV